MKGSEPVAAPSASGSSCSPSSDWRVDPDRRPWVVNSLRQRARELRTAEQRCRTMFQKPYMGEAANWLADVYCEAAELLERRLGDVSRAELIAYAKALEPAGRDHEERSTDAGQASGMNNNPKEPS